MVGALPVSFLELCLDFRMAGAGRIRRGLTLKDKTVQMR